MAPSERELDRACLLIAAEEYPGLDVEVYLGELDRLARRVKELLPGDAGPQETVHHLRSVLAGEERFQGNREDYYDPRNSFLNEVLDRRTGIPITLSVVYMEVARRVGFLLEGIGFPGHFIVGHSGPRGRLLLDPFEGGRALERPELGRLLERSFGGEVQLSEDMLRPATTSQILFRMLNNLKGIYLRQQDSGRALAVVERLLGLAPEAAGERRDRALLLARLDRPLEALRELLRYREIAPEHHGPEVDPLIARLREDVARRN